MRLRAQQRVYLLYSFLNVLRHCRNVTARLSRRRCAVQRANRGLSRARSLAIWSLTKASTNLPVRLQRVPSGSVVSATNCTAPHSFKQPKFKQPSKTTDQLGTGNSLPLRLPRRLTNMAPTFVCTVNGLRKVAKRCFD